MVYRRLAWRCCSAAAKLLACLGLILASQALLAQQAVVAQQAGQGEAAPYSDQSGPLGGRAREDSSSAPGAGSTWTEEDQLLWELDQGREGRSPLPRAGRSDEVRDPVMQDLKSLMDEYDPRDRLDLDLPLILEDQELLERRPQPRGSAAQDGPPRANDGEGVGAPSGRSGAGSQRSITIGEAGDLIADLVLDTRLYFYLFFSIAVIVGAFGLVGVFRHLRAKKGHRRHRRHGKRHRKRHRVAPDYSRSRRSAGRRRRPAHS